MEEVQQVDQQTLDLIFLKDSTDASLLSFLQIAQSSNAILHLAIINFRNGTPLLFLHALGQGFLIEVKNAKSFAFERFFANLQFFINIDRDLASILYHLPLQKNNIHDVNIAQSLINHDKSYDNIGYFKLNTIDVPGDINISYVKSVLIKGMAISSAWDVIIQDLDSINKRSIYESIIAERFQRLQLYNTPLVELDRISSLYQVLDIGEKERMQDVFKVLQSSANYMSIPISNIATLQTLEVFVLKAPKVFEDISRIAGFNKKIVHSAIIRKILAIFSKTESSIKRNRPMEIAIDAILSLCSTQHGIDKSMVASKHDIIAFLNGNLNVDFLNGWKKEVFGNYAVAFIENKSIVEVKNMQLSVTNK
ncbi:MAG: hypothetical protein ACI9CD_000506 [Candidatus Deianiraeaceae bacterium]|jgi:hypothetical protein